MHIHIFLFLLFFIYLFFIYLFFLFFNYFWGWAQLSPHGLGWTPLAQPGHWPKPMTQLGKGTHQACMQG